MAHHVPVRIVKHSGAKNGILFLWMLSRVRIYGVMSRSAGNCKNSPFP